MKTLEQEAEEKFFENLRTQRKVEEYQIERFKRVCSDFSLFVDKVIEKYNSKKYKDFYYSKGKMPSNELFYFLYLYVGKYGIQATKKEYRKQGTPFTTAIYYHEGYYFHRIDGQGSEILIYKKE